MVAFALGVFIFAIVLVGTQCGAHAQETPADPVEEPSGTPTPHPELHLDELLTVPGLWDKSLAALLKEPAAMEAQLTWVGAAKKSARTARPALFYLGQPAQELLLDAGSDGRVAEVAVIFFARGNMKELTRSAFETLVETVSGSVDAASGLRDRFGAGPQLRRSAAARAHVTEWAGDNALYEVVYSSERGSGSGGFRPEFVRVNLRPAPPKPPPLVNVAAGSTVQRGLQRREVAEPKREDNGDVWLPDVPMVDQGERGYCVVASVERVLRYYGVEADQHELAQIADASGLAGTSPAAMADALKRLSSRLKVRPRTVIDFDYDALEDILKNYNRAARTERKEQIGMVHDQGVNVAATYAQMQSEVLKAGRARQQGDYKKFLNAIGQAVRERTPLLWSVQLGIVEEPGIPQNAGGHMRLVIGLNETTGELIYSDSWGIGHEKKRMTLEDAWAITTGLITIEPLQS